MLHITGNEGEIEALKHMVSVKDIKVSQQGWKFSERNPEPPLANVMNTGFWTAPHYEALRQRLARPLLEVNLKTGGDYLTVSTQGEGRVVSEPVLTQEGEETQVHFPSLLFALPTPEVPSACYLGCSESPIVKVHSCFLLCCVHHRPIPPH